MNDPAIALIDERIRELVKEANQLVAPYNAAIGELNNLRQKLLPAVPPETPETVTPLSEL